jgi:hypothetical protein
VPRINLWEPCYFAKVPDGPQTYTLDVLWLQKEGAKVFYVNSTVSVVSCPWVQEVSHDVCGCSLSVWFWHSDDLASWYILIIKPTRCTISQIYFDKVPYMFRTDLLPIIRSLNTVYVAIGICHASSVDCLLADSQQSETCRVLHHNKLDKYCISALL